MNKAPNRLDVPVGLSGGLTPERPVMQVRMGKAGELLKQRLLAISQLMLAIANTTDSNGPTIVP